MAFNSQRFPSKKIPAAYDNDDDVEEYDSVEIKRQYKNKVEAKEANKRGGEEAGEKTFQGDDNFQHKAPKFKGQAAKAASDKRGETQKESHERELPSKINIVLESDTKRQIKLLTSAILELCDVLRARKSV